MLAIKFAEGDDNLIEGWGMPYGGPHGGQDLADEHFSDGTSFCFEWFAERPVLYNHGLDNEAGPAVIGRVKSWTKKDLGVWVQAQLDAHSEYVDSVKELVRKGVLSFSSGAMAHLVRKDAKSGEIKVWPWVELSVTPTPCNLLATLDFATAAKHFKSAGLDLPDEDELKKKLDADDRNSLDDSDFAYIDPEGGRHLPMHDASHVRAALARFDQTDFESEEAKAKAKRKLMARAKEMGIEVGDGEKALNSYTMIVHSTQSAEELAEQFATLKLLEGDKAAIISSGEALDSRLHGNDGEVVARWTGTAWTKLATTDMPDHDGPSDKPVAKKPAPMAMMREMAKGMDVSDEEMDAMLKEMGDMEGMSEEEMREKMAAMLAKRPAMKMSMVMIRMMMDEMASEMGMEMSAADKVAMAKEMGDPADMTDAEAKKKMRQLMDGYKEKMAKKAVSFEDVRSQLDRMVNESLVTTNPLLAPASVSEAWGYVECTYADHAIFKLHRNGEERIFRIPYTLGADGNVAGLGQPEEVEEIYVPMGEAKRPQLPMGMHADIAKFYATSLLESTRDLHERRVKEGRTLSTGNRRQIGDTLSAMREACDRLQDLLDSTETKPRESGAEEARAKAVRLRLRVFEMFNDTMMMN